MKLLLRLKNVKKKEQSAHAACLTTRNTGFEGEEVSPENTILCPAMIDAMIPQPV